MMKLVSVSGTLNEFRSCKKRKGNSKKSMAKQNLAKGKAVRSLTVSRCHSLQTANSISPC